MKDAAPFSKIQNSKAIRSSIQTKLFRPKLESLRDCRRLQILRVWGSLIQTRDTVPRSESEQPDWFLSSREIDLALGCHLLHCRQDRVYTGDFATVVKEEERSQKSSSGAQTERELLKQLEGENRELKRATVPNPSGRDVKTLILEWLTS